MKHAFFPDVVVVAKRESKREVELIPKVTFFKIYRAKASDKNFDDTRELIEATTRVVRAWHLAPSYKILQRSVVRDFFWFFSMLDDLDPCGMMNFVSRKSNLSQRGVRFDPLGSYDSKICQ